MGAHGGNPFQGGKDLLLFPILRFIDNLGLFRDVSYPLLGNRSSDNVPGQVFHGIFTTRLNLGGTEDVEARSRPGPKPLV